QAELHFGVTAAGIIELTPGRYAGWVQRGSGVFSDMSQQNWLSLPSPDTGQAARLMLNQSTYRAVPWYLAFYWQRRLGLGLMGLTALGLLAAVGFAVVQRKRRQLSWLAALLSLTAGSLLLACCLGWYLVFTGRLELGVPAVTRWLGYAAWAAGVLAFGSLITMLAAVIRKACPAWLTLTVVVSTMAVVGLLWYAYYWYLI
ncbi:MAG: hypothetical protein ACYC6L_17930, partial [Anaerolineae bacterium]